MTLGLVRWVRSEASRTGDIVADASGVITSWGTTRTFLEVGT
jgi:hypothetical protein